MKIEYLPLSEITENEANPRTISKEKFSKLVASILQFPTMLAIRPIVIDDGLFILGGNMRYRALLSISQMQMPEIKKIIGKEKQKAEHWQRFLDKPTAPVIKASDLTAEERQRFIIEDNVAFGEWDWDKLANEWDGESLDEWGLDVWQPEKEGEGKEQSGSANNKDLSDQLSECFKIEIDCGSEAAQQELFNELEERGLKCRLLTL